MRPLTDTLPKPLVPVAGRTLLDRALDFVTGGGVAEAVVNISYRGDQVRAHLAARPAPPVVTLSHEEAPLETGGGIREALPLLGVAPFFSVNSDIICLPGENHPLTRLREAWDDTDMDALLLLHPVERAVGYDGAGDFFLAGDGTLTRRGSAPAAPYVFAGVQLLHPRLFAGCPESGAFSLNLLYDRSLPRLRGLAHDGAWLHVGDAAGLAAAECRLQGVTA